MVKEFREIYTKKYDISLPMQDKTTAKKTKMLIDRLDKKKKKILILGCGPCYEGKMLKSEGHYIVGVDINPEMLKIAKAKNNCDEVHECDVTERMPFNDKSFDIIIGFELIEHLGFVDSFLRECYRLLKKGSLLVLSTPSESYWKNRLLILLGRDILSDFHPRLFTPKTLKEKVEKFGFQTESIKGIGRFGRLISTRFPFLSLGGDFVIFAKKR